MGVHQCPECELRFVHETELREHLDTEHPGRVGERAQRPAAPPSWPRERE